MAQEGGEGRRGRRSLVIPPGSALSGLVGAALQREAEGPKNVAAGAQTLQLLGINPDAVDAGSLGVGVQVVSQVGGEKPKK